MSATTSWPPCATTPTGSMSWPGPDPLPPKATAWADLGLPHGLREMTCPAMWGAYTPPLRVAVLSAAILARSPDSSGILARPPRHAQVHVHVHVSSANVGRSPCM